MTPSRDAVRRWAQAAGEPDVVLLDGFHAVKHALRFGAPIRLMLTADRPALLDLAAELASDIVPLLDRLVVEVPAEEVRAVVPRADPTGVVALARRPAPAVLAEALDSAPRRAPVVLLDRPRNLGNVGAVIRLVAGFGATGVITTGDLDPWHPNVIRGSAGLHFAVAVAGRDLAAIPPGPVLAFDAAGEDIRSVAVPDDALLAFGSERYGLSPELRRRADRLVAVPMAPGVSSFNLATTVAMGLFHWLSRPA
jgi:TrmH family RNA methyltransferase